MKNQSTITARWRETQTRELPVFQSRLLLAVSPEPAAALGLANGWLRSLAPEQRAARLSKLTGFTR
jgi:hypothetical protein